MQGSTQITSSAIATVQVGMVPGQAKEPGTARSTT
jgi:hypothetical protein